MSYPSNQIVSSSEGRNLLKLLLREPTTVSPQKQKLQMIQQLGQYPWAHEINLNHYICQQMVPSIQTQSVYKPKYHYTYESVTPKHYFFNTAFKKEDVFDYDDYLPQGDLQWLRIRNDPRYDIEKKKSEEESK